MTSLCAIENITIGAFSHDIGGLFIVNEKSIGGRLGKLADRFFAGNDVRNCRFVKIDSLGHRLPNGSFSGAKKLLLEDKIDMYARIEDFKGENENLFTLSTACFAEKFVIIPIINRRLHLGHFLDNPKSQKNVDSLSFIENTKFITNSLYSAFISLSIVIFISYLVPTKNIRLAFEKSKNYFTYYYRDRFVFNKRNLIMIFFAIFIKFYLNLISSSIKTNDVITELNDVIYNMEILNKTKRHACWVKTESYMRGIMNSNDNNFLNKIFKQKRKDNMPCYLDETVKDIKLIDQIEIDHAFSIMPKSILYVLLKFVLLFKKTKKMVFETEFFDFETIQVHYLRSNLNVNVRNRLLSLIYGHTEVGLYLKYHHDLGIESKLGIEVDIFTSVHQLKDDCVKVYDLKFKYFKNLFTILIVIYLILIFISILYKSSKFTIKKLKNFIFYSYEYLFDIQFKFVLKCLVIIHYFILNIINSAHKISQNFRNHTKSK